VSKILLVCGKFFGGGGERNFSNLLSELKLSHNVNYFLTAKKKNESKFRLIRLLKKIINLNNFINKNKVGTIISFLDYNNLFVILTKIIFRKKLKVIISERTDPYKHKPTLTFNILRTLIYNFADYLVLQDSYFKNFFWFVNKKKIKIIENLYFKRSQSRLTTKKKTFERKKHFLYLITAGRLIQSKRILEIIKIFESINNNRLILHIYGDGPLKKEIKNFINDKKLNKSVILKGYNKNLINLYNKYDLFIFNSYFEGLPNVLIEASHSGLPIISFKYNPGVKKIVQNRKNGFVIHSDKELENKIKLLTQNKKLLRKMKNSNFHKKKEVFNNYKVMTKWRKLLS